MLDLSRSGVKPAKWVLMGLYNEAPGEESLNNSGAGQHHGPHEIPIVFAFDFAFPIFAKTRYLDE